MRPTKTTPLSRKETSGSQLSEVTIAIIGPEGSGKSTLVRVLLGKDRATSDQLPIAKRVQRHRIQLDDPLARLVLLDADLSTQVTADELEWIVEHVDLILLVCQQSQTQHIDDSLQIVLNACIGIPVIGVLMLLDQNELGQQGRWENEPRAEEANGNAKSDAKANHSSWELVRQWRAGFGGQLADAVPLYPIDTTGAIFGVAEYLLPAIARNLNQSQVEVLSQAVSPELSDGLGRK
jgi:predicted GTPase